MYIDTHTHLQFSEFDADRAMVIGNAKKAGVKQFIVPGVDTHSSTGAIHIAKQNPNIVFASVGFHPYEAKEDVDLSTLTRLLASDASVIVAIGECGLDYHLYGDEPAVSKKGKQKDLFAAQLEIAAQYNLPVIMHCRDAFEDFFEVVDSVPGTVGVIHCFSGALQELRMAQARNLYIGIDGNVTYSKSLAATVASVPLSMMLLETDAPYLTPVPHRGKRNEPKYIPLTAAYIGTLKHISSQLVAEETTLNAKTLFRLP